MSKGNINIIYIAGYGHSGSTILEMLLNTSKNVVGFGEIAELGNKNIGYYVSKNPDKSYCVKYFNQIQKDLLNINENWQGLTTVSENEHLFQYRKKNDIIKYKKIWSTFFNAVSTVDNPNNNYFIDSSKTSLKRARRPILLSEISHLNINCIHIFRHPDPILFRIGNKTNNRGGFSNFKMLSVSLNWIFSNLWSIYLSKFCEKYVRISFEELCDKPELTLHKLGNEMRIDLSEAILRVSKKQKLTHTCGLAGNRLIMQKSVFFDTSEATKKVPLTNFQKILSLFLSPFYSFFKKRTL